MAERNLYYLHELSDYKVADGYPDVRGWEVKDADNRTIGKVDNLLVSKNARRVVYLDVEIDEDLVKEHRGTSASANRTRTNQEYPRNTTDTNSVHEFVNEDGDDHLIIPIGQVTLDDENDHIRTTEVNASTFASHKRFRKGAFEDPENELLIYRFSVRDTDVKERSGVTEDMYNRSEFQYDKNRTYANR